MSRLFYVYELWNPITSLPFYVGKGTYQGSKTTRITDHLREAQKIINHKTGNKHKRNTIIKILKEGYNLDYKIVFETYDESLAFEEEKRLISLYGRRDLKTGILTNLTDGGDGIGSGWVMPQWLRDLRRDKMVGRNNFMYGKNHSESSKQKMSSTKKRKFQSGELVQHKHSQEHKDKLKTDNAGGKSVEKPVFQIDPTTGNVLAQYSSAQVAAKTLNGVYQDATRTRGRGHSNIHSCASKFLNRTAYGYYWRYCDNVLVSNGSIDVSNLNDKRMRKLSQYSYSGELIKVWNSLTDVSQHFNKTRSHLIHCIKNNKTWQGYYWKYN